jgi:methenyltetrahydrofolate cyclohydrolase
VSGAVPRPTPHVTALHESRQWLVDDHAHAVREGAEAPHVVTAPGAETLEGFLEKLASDAPAPGGGAAAAVTVALAAALVAMVCRVTARRDAGAPPAMGETATEADTLRAAALGLGADDSTAYARVLEARRRAPAERATAVADALRHATEVPVATARMARDVLARCMRVAPLARASTLSDLNVASALAWAGLEAGAGTARTNLAEAEDAEYVTATLTEIARLTDEGARLRQRVAEALAARTSAGPITNAVSQL